MKTEEEKSRLEVRSSNEMQDLQRTIEKLREDISAIAEERDDYSKRFDEAVSDKDENVNDQVRVSIQVVWLRRKIVFCRFLTLESESLAQEKGCHHYPEGKGENRDQDSHGGRAQENPGRH